MNLGSYMEKLDGATIDRLYESLHVCQAILHGVPPLARQYVLRLLHCRAVQSEWVDAWAAERARSKHQAAMRKLKDLHVVRQITLRSGAPALELHNTFRRQMQASLQGTGARHLGSREAPDDVLACAPSAEALERHAAAAWEALLLHVIDPGQPPPSPEAAHTLGQKPLALDLLLQGAGLTTAGSGTVTEAGFRFLLLDAFSQLWVLMTEYIDSAQRRSGGELAEVLAFLLQMGFTRVGQPFAAAALSPFEAGIAAHLGQLGLLLPFKALDGSAWLAPTRLVLALSGGSAGEDAAAGFIIVETNYRVYAYTSSPLQTAILSMFTRTECRLPNLYVGTITRESVTKALGSHIRAPEMVQYLAQHAHPQVAGRAPIVPAVVQDQIALWQAEVDRVRHHRAVLYENFATPQMFQRTAQLASERGWLLWQDAQRQRMVGRAEGHASVREFIKSIK